VDALHRSFLGEPRRKEVLLPPPLKMQLLLDLQEWIDLAREGVVAEEELLVAVVEKGKVDRWLWRRATESLLSFVVL
jgi:hypothetical protein